LLLDENNGPWHNRENRPCSADAPVYYIKDEDKIVYRLSYYYIGHISKFIGSGARVIASSSYSSNVETVAFENKDGSIVLVLLNRNERDLPVIIRLGDSIEKINLEKHSIVTAVIKK
jgi:glucosylceramidase